MPQDSFVAGESSNPCYDNLFQRLSERSLAADAKASGLPPHLRNPACYIYGKDNACLPGTGFTSPEEEKKFAEYRPFQFVLPVWQKLADTVSLISIGLVLIWVSISCGFFVFKTLREMWLSILMPAQERCFLCEGVAGLLRDKTRNSGLPPLPPAVIDQVVELSLAEPVG